VSSGALVGVDAVTVVVEVDLLRAAARRVHSSAWPPAR
jgi:hypothetical protein